MILDFANENRVFVKAHPAHVRVCAHVLTRPLWGPHAVSYNDGA